MNNEEQKKIFANNLRHYININGKQQKDVAKAIGEKPSTLNMWATAKSLPTVSKIQKLADYFGIAKSDLIDQKTNSTETFKDIMQKIELYDPKFKRIIMQYYDMPKDKKDALCLFLETFIR